MEDPLPIGMGLRVPKPAVNALTAPPPTWNLANMSQETATTDGYRDVAVGIGKEEYLRSPGMDLIDAIVHLFCSRGHSRRTKKKTCGAASRENECTVQNQA